MTERQEDVYGHELEIAAKRKAWEQQKKAEVQQAEREQKQAALESYLRRRAQAWEETTGSEPPSEELKRWRQQYLDEQEQKHQAELAERRARAEAEYHF